MAAAKVRYVIDADQNHSALKFIKQEREGSIHSGLAAGG